MDADAGAESWRLACAWDRRHARCACYLSGTGGRPAVGSVLQVNLITLTALDSDDGLNRNRTGPFPFERYSDEKYCFY